MNPTTIFDAIRWVQQLEQLALHNKCESPAFLRPHHFVALALTLWQHGYYNLTVPKKLQGYAARMHLWDALGMQAPTSVVENDPGDRFVPLVRLDDANNVDETAKRLARVARCYGADEKTTDSLATSMMEIIGNCFAHAEVSAPLKGVACAQSWPQGGLAQIAIGDAGIGIRPSLSANPDLVHRLKSENSCELATELGVTSKPKKGHAGYGLALTRQLLSRAGGRLLVLSCEEWFSCSGENLAAGRLPTPWQGTIAVLEWSTRSPLRVREVYDSWPLPEGFDDEDFNFED
jgi:anti-sigma regulatory factor (Ser/Thr protein kinase)